jgi:hypothetical protein
MKKTIRPFTAQLVTFTSSLPFATVIERLDAAINKAGAKQFLARFYGVKEKDELQGLVDECIGESGFM